MVNSKQKGNRYERECVDWLNQVFESVFKPIGVGIKNKVAHRTPRSGGFATQTGWGKFSGDAFTSVRVGDQEVKFDFKFYKKLGIFKFWNKHKKECSPQDIPVLIIHANNEIDHLVVMERNDWSQLVEKAVK